MRTAGRKPRHAWSLPLSFSGDKPMLTNAVLKKMWPSAPAAKLTAIVRVSKRVLVANGIEDPLVCAHLMAQISHENGAGTVIRESMSYTHAERIMEIFGVGRHSAAVTQSEAARLVRNAPALAERVYGLGNPKKARELGNTRPGDGFKYRGGGDLQLTGGANYKRIGELTGFDLYENPDQLSDPEISFEVAVVEFVKLKCVAPAQKDDILTVTKRVNGGTNGIAERRVWLRKWRAVLKADDDAVGVPVAFVAEAPVPPPEEPRGGESDATKTVNGVTVARTLGGGLATITAGAQIASSVVGPVGDTITQVKTVTDNTGSIVETTRSVASIAPDGFWLNALAFMRSPLFLTAVLVTVCLAWGISWYLRRHEARV